MKAKGIALSASGVGYSYGVRRALVGVTAEFLEGEFVSVIGPNGSGKTTLLKLLCGARKPGSGSVKRLGKDVWGMRPLERARQFAVVDQNEKHNFAFTCLEIVMLGLHAHQGRFNKPTDEHLNWVIKAMELTGTLGLADRQASEVSGGEYQRVLLARALAQMPRVLFLDEAMSGLDVSARLSMQSMLRKLCADEGMTAICVNHDLNAVYAYSDRVLALSDGQVYAFGSPVDVMNETFFERVFAVKADVSPGRGFYIRDVAGDRRGG